MGMGEGVRTRDGGGSIKENSRRFRTQQLKL